MRREYDFSKGVRGKFYRPGATFLIPVYLEPEVQAAVAQRAAEDGTDLSAEVNRMLRREIAATPAKQKKAGNNPGSAGELLLIGANTLRARLSRSSVKGHTARTITGRFKSAQTYSLNPAARTTKARTPATAKKTAKRAKR